MGCQWGSCKYQELRIILHDASLWEPDAVNLLWAPSTKWCRWLQDHCRQSDQISITSVTLPCWNSTSAFQGYIMELQAAAIHSAESCHEERSLYVQLVILSKLSSRLVRSLLCTHHCTCAKLYVSMSFKCTGYGGRMNLITASLRLIGMDSLVTLFLERQKLYWCNRQKGAFAQPFPSPLEPPGPRGCSFTLVPEPQQ